MCSKRCGSRVLIEKCLGMKEVRVRDCHEFPDVEETCEYLFHVPGK